MANKLDAETALLWDATEPATTPDKLGYVNNLERIFREFGLAPDNIILDVAGGTGFPCIDLAERRWQVLYSDPSTSMSSKCFDKVGHREDVAFVFAGMLIGAAGMKWEDLVVLPENSYEGVLCLRNSLPYAASWAVQNPDMSEAMSALMKSLHGMYHITKPRRILVVDKHIDVPESEFDLGLVDIEGQEMHLTGGSRTINRTRHWFMKATVNGQVELEHRAMCYALTDEELEGMLKETGFREVHRRDTDACTYNTFVAVK